MPAWKFEGEEKWNPIQAVGGLRWSGFLWRQPGHEDKALGDLSAGTGQASQGSQDPSSPFPLDPCPSPHHGLVEAAPLPDQQPVDGARLAEKEQ